MFRLDAEKPVRFCDGLSRRDFLHAGALTALGLSLSDLFELKARGAVHSGQETNCIFLMLVGGPSHIDCWDLKPEAPAGIRGPFRPIKTRVPGIEISEIFPRTAGQADKFALVRSLHHSGPAVHQAGHQLMQTGRLFEDRVEYPHIGSVVGRLRGPRDRMPPHVLLPQPIGRLGGELPPGQNAGFMGEQYDPVTPGSGLLQPHCVSALRPDRRVGLRHQLESSVREFEARTRDAAFTDHFQQAYGLISSSRAREAFDLNCESAATKDRYGRNQFGMSCLLARRLVERGVRFVTVNMFETVFHEITWDIHGTAPFSSLSCYRDQVGPMFDHAYAYLLEDLHDRGLLANTLVVATGEFGRDPRINPAGGRDHWPECWTMLFAGGGIKGGQVIGSSDEIGAHPKDRPTTPPEVVATIMSALGIDPRTRLEGPDGEPLHLVEPGVNPIAELF